MKRPTRRQAVLQFRLLQSEYDELAREATRRGLTISEEAARRLRLYRAPVSREREDETLFDHGHAVRRGS